MGLPLTDVDDLLNTPSTKSSSATTTATVIGSPVLPTEVKSSLTGTLYDQLCNRNDAVAVAAIARACVHLSAIYARLKTSLNLDVASTRQTVIMWAIYELYMATGREEAGREWRIKAKDLIVASLGSYPEAAQQQEGRYPIGAVQVPSRRDRRR